MSEDNKGCKCNEKELCQKMQNAALRKAVDELKKIVETASATTVRQVVRRIANIFRTYQCLPGKCLLDSAFFTENNISIFMGAKLSDSEIISVKILIEEIETFLES